MTQGSEESQTQSRAVIDEESQIEAAPVPLPKAPKKKFKTSKTTDPRLEEAYQLMKDSAKAQNTQTDSFGVYGQHIANKLRGYSRQTQIEVEHIFNEILNNADIGHYDTDSINNPHFISSAPIDVVTHHILSPPTSGITTPTFTNSTCPTPNSTTAAHILDMPHTDYTNL